ncbi:MAG: sulfatase family protein [Akkermansiaceae bacterium]
MKLTSILFLITANILLATDKPNIVLILADDLGSGDVSSYNPQSKLNTPNIDFLVSEGIKFTDGHSNSAVCTPTRYGVLTGRYAWRTRLKKGVLNGYSPALIAPERATIASELEKAGYATACIGKWHLGMDIAKSGKGTWDYTAPIKNGPTARGFDYYLGISASLDMPPYALIENDRFKQIPDGQQEANRVELTFVRAGDISSEFKHVDYLPLMTQQACDWIKTTAKQEAPYFLYMPLPSPHKPVFPSAEFKGKSGIGDYGDYVLETDWSVGQVIKTIKETGEYDNTLIIFTSDNASFALPSIYHVTKTGHAVNAHYRGQKTDAFEGGHRVPFIISWPSENGYAKNKGKTSKQVISTVDLLATIKNIIHPEQLTHADGISFHPYLKGELNTPEAVKPATIHHSVNGTFAIRSGKWKLILSNKSGGRSSGKVATKGQLYDMENDPSETTNLYTQHPEIIENLTNTLTTIKAQQN